MLTPRISMLVNGSPQGFFETSRGLRQGDPISPFLFVIMVEALGRLISWKRQLGVWKGISIATGVDLTTHLQFVDDNFMMGYASLRKARFIKKSLDSFSKASRQCVNWHKSDIFFFHTNAGLRRQICNILGMKQSALLGKFLGIPFFEGVCKPNLWNDLSEKCFKRMEIWKGKWLSYAGCILLLQTIISAIPIYSMSCLKIP